ncbi:MAG: hypothetical protein ACP6IT_05915 [Candidatus Thorarchaeota archaeon]
MHADTELCGVYQFPAKHHCMRTSHWDQTRLTDFEEESRPRSANSRTVTRRPVEAIWVSGVSADGNWVVCDFDGTVFFAQFVNGTIYAHGHKAACRWCGADLEVREDRVFCAGKCGKYQGRISENLSDFLRWNGATSCTLRKAIAGAMGFRPVEEDSWPPVDTPSWSLLQLDDESISEGQ